jgi:DNA-binding XRE family transcriptional regulator
MKHADVRRMTALERKALLEELAAMNAEGALSLGEVVRILRAVMLGMNRERFAQTVRIATSALALIEDDPDANPTLETLNKLLAPFGGKVGVLFPRLVERPAPTPEQQRRRAALEAALAGTRRKRRGGAGS